MLTPYLLSSGAWNEYSRTFTKRQEQYQSSWKCLEKDERIAGKGSSVIRKEEGTGRGFCYMKILIVSDTHGHDRNLEIILEQVGAIDHFIHLGDVEGHEDYIEQIVDCPVHMVAGNNDFFSDLPREEEFWLGNYRVFITHGNYYGVSMGTSRLKEEALSRKAQIVMYGHTHRPEIDIQDNITILNPGSLSYPRQWGREPSYIMMEIDRNGQAHYTVHYLED